MDDGVLEPLSFIVNVLVRHFLDNSQVGLMLGSLEKLAWSNTEPPFSCIDFIEKLAQQMAHQLSEGLAVLIMTSKLSDF